MCVSLSTPINITLYCIQLRNCNIRFSFYLLSLSLLDTIVHSNYISVSISGLSLFATRNIFPKLNRISLIILLTVSRSSGLLPQNIIWHMMLLVIRSLPQTCKCPPLYIILGIFSPFHHQLAQFLSWVKWIYFLSLYSVHQNSSILLPKSPRSSGPPHVKPYFHQLTSTVYTGIHLPSYFLYIYFMGSVLK